MAQDGSVTYQETCTKAEHQMLKRLRQLAKDPTAVVALVSTINRDRFAVRPIPPNINLAIIKAIDKAQEVG